MGFLGPKKTFFILYSYFLQKNFLHQTSFKDVENVCVLGGLILEDLGSRIVFNLRVCVACAFISGMIFLVSPPPSPHISRGSARGAQKINAKISGNKRAKALK